VRTRTNLWWLVLLGLAGVGVTIAAWPEPPAPAPAAKAAPGLDFAPSDAQKKKMEELRASLGSGAARFPLEERRAPGNAPLFMYMAGTSSDERVVTASLEAIPAAYGARSTKKPLPDGDVERVLVKNLSSPNAVIVVGALHAARVPLMMEVPSAKVAHRVADLVRAEQTPRGVRLLALQVLNVQRAEVRSVETLSAFIAASSSEPAVALLALIGLELSAPSLGREATLANEARTRARELLRASDPGVRGTALRFLAVPGVDPEAAASARLLRQDPHAYVRAVAATTLGALGTPGDIHGLLPLTDDLGEARIVCEGPPEADGQPGKLVLSVMGRRLVGESALRAIEALAKRRQGAAAAPSGNSPRAFPRLELGQRSTGDAELAANAKLVRAWYAAEQSHLPQAP